jgi:predicted PurR-regulated permease PerM
MFRTSFRIGLLGLAFFCVIPASLGVSRMIENTYHESIEATIESATQTAEEIKAETESIAESAPAETESEPEKPSGIADTIGGWLNSVTESGRELTENITNSVNQSTEAFRQLFNNMLEAFAVMLVTSCVIPILVLLLFVWMVKLIIGSGTGPMPPMPKP